MKRLSNHKNLYTYKKAPNHLFYYMGAGFTDARKTFAGIPLCPSGSHLASYKLDPAKVEFRARCKHPVDFDGNQKVDFKLGMMLVGGIEYRLFIQETRIEGTLQFMFFNIKEFLLDRNKEQRFYARLEREQRFRNKNESPPPRTRKSGAHTWRLWVSERWELEDMEESGIKGNTFAEANVTLWEMFLETVPGFWGARCKVPSPLRKCWTLDSESEQINLEEAAEGNHHWGVVLGENQDAPETTSQAAADDGDSSRGLTVSTLSLQKMRISSILE